MSDSGASDRRTSVASGDLVIPGDKIEIEDGWKPGSGVLIANDVMVATKLGHIDISGTTVNVNPVHTTYFPRPGDLVIAVVEGMRANIWFMELNAPFNAILPMSLAPNKVEYGGTRDAMDVGTTLLCRVQEVDESHSSVVTMKGVGLRKINSGFVDTVPPHLTELLSKGHDSIVQHLKDVSGCRIILAANGRVWVDGPESSIRTVRRALDFIKDNQNSSSLDNELRDHLNGRKGE